MKIAGGPDERKYSSLDVEQVEADGTFSGYASLFGRVDLGRDLVERGAFSESITKRGAGGIRMLFQHDPNQPIGAWREIREDERGLFVRGKLATGVGRAREVLELMRDGALDGLSIGFRSQQAVSEPRTGIRRIKKADLWEISVVTFPMLPEARVETVKGRGDLPSPREFERWLTRDAGLTRSEAKTVIARGFAHLLRERDAAPGTPERLAATIRRATKLLQQRD
ncbi:HK97 family phage prohead protease [Chelativorans sp. AA-79]|uniref:HK97 family phage prohead protease n=1 Tax=Chelativorans sp. AA-79 TaxID=3028735 RepID=UPI0023F9BED0|nr:HK97 family phage prohead protease [Chelativorans sp. AA-79]WEX11938.1 HK97 family phage prohead protease [Chelativorans sp. AA-79]